MKYILTHFYSFNLLVVIRQDIHVRIPITNQEIIRGFKGDEFVHFNLIYLLAKKYLYQCRCSVTFPGIETFKSQLYNLIETERGIYIMKINLGRDISR